MEGMLILCLDACLKAMFRERPRGVVLKIKNHEVLKHIVHASHLEACPMSELRLIH